MKDLIRSYRKPTPPRWRKAGDLALLLIPIIQSGIASAPPGVIGMRASFWLGFASSILLVCFKFWANTKVEGE